MAAIIVHNSKDGPFKHSSQPLQWHLQNIKPSPSPWIVWLITFIVVTYEIRVFFKGAQKEVFSSIFKKTL
jgi:hypothetical protein